MIWGYLERYDNICGLCWNELLAKFPTPRWKVLEKLNKKIIWEFKNLLIKRYPDKKKLQTFSFRTQQNGIFQESKSTKVQNREEVEAGIRSIIVPRDGLSNFLSVGLILEDFI